MCALKSQRLENKNRKNTATTIKTEPTDTREV